MNDPVGAREKSDSGVTGVSVRDAKRMREPATRACAAEALSAPRTRLAAITPPQSPGPGGTSPALRENGLAMVFIATERPIKTTLHLPLYHTGLTDSALVREQEGGSTRHRLGREYGVDVSVSLGAKGITWIVVEAC